MSPKTPKGPGVQDCGKQACKQRGIAPGTTPSPRLVKTLPEDGQMRKGGRVPSGQVNYVFQINLFDPAAGFALLCRESALHRFHP